MNVKKLEKRFILSRFIPIQKAVEKCHKMTPQLYKFPHLNDRLDLHILGMRY
jgi:hypothetical protein